MADQWQDWISIALASLALPRWQRIMQCHQNSLLEHPVMAWLQEDPSGNYHISFRFGGYRFKRSLHTSQAKQAQTRLKRLEENIRLVEAGRMELLADADIPTFLLSDGKLNGKPVVAKSLSLTELFESFFNNLPNGNLEESTLSGMHLHKRHLIQAFGPRFHVQKLTLKHLQDYVIKRSKQPGIRGRLS